MLVQATTPRTRNGNNLTNMRSFRLVTGLVLLTTALLKVFHLVFGGSLDGAVDGLLRVNKDMLGYSVVLMELAVICLAVADKKGVLFLNCAGLLFTAFVVYRIGWLISGGEGSCGCIGGGFADGPIVENVTNYSLLFVSVGMSIWSFVILRKTGEADKNISLNRLGGATNPFSVGLAIAGLSWSVSAETPSTATTVQARGNVNVESFTRDGKTIREQSYSAGFKLLISNQGQFALTLDNHAFFRGKKTILAYDGETYYYIYEGGRSAPANRNYRYSAELSSEKLPIIAVEDVARDSIWLGCVSGFFFRDTSEVGLMPHLLDRPRWNPLAYGYRYRTVLAGAGDFPIVKSFELHTDAASSLTEPELEASEIRLDIGDFDTQLRRDIRSTGMQKADGVKVIDIRWGGKGSASSNEGGFPYKINLVEYFEAEKGKNQRRVVSIDIDEWEQLEETKQTFVPKLDAPVHVIDYRLRRRDSRRYVDRIAYHLAQPGEPWPKVDQPELVEKFDSTFMFSHRPDRTKIGFWRIAAFLCATIAVFLGIKQFAKSNGAVSQASGDQLNG